MKKLMFILVGISLFIVVNAQNMAEKAPISPDFLMFNQKYDKLAEKKSSDDYFYGYIPSPLYINFNQSSFNTATKKSTEDLPAVFDLREKGFMSPVKDQNPLGSCWTFASIGAIESSWLKKGYGAYDLSEENMGSCHGFDFGINDGGNDLIAAAYLTRLSGPVLEKDDPYSKDPNVRCPGTVLPIPAYVPVVMWLPKDINTIKKAIYDYGAVTTSIFTGGNYMYLYYNNVDYTFHYDGNTPVDHAVLIAGWDDNMVVKGGSSSPPETVGAWIVKNSWGSEWGDNGYFYVSYDDSRFLSSAAVFHERIETNAVDTVYMEDFLGATTSYGYRQETAFGLVKYIAPEKNFIDKVGSYINSEGTFIDIEIYDDFTGDSLLENLISASYNNIAKYPGYYTFDIAAMVEGDFYIKIKYTSPGYNYPIPAEASVLLSGEPYASPHINNKGFSWISKDEKEWKALGADIENAEADLCIRAYANRNTDINAFFTAQNNLACRGSNVIFTDNSNGEINSYIWNFGEGATPDTANSIGPHTVSYSTTGLKDISLTITGPNGTRTLKKDSYIEVVDELDVSLPYSEVLLPKGNSHALTATGAEEYSWSPPDGLNSTIGNPVIASPEDTTTYTVTGTLGNCSGSASVTINVVENPINDDICEAIEILPEGYIGSFTNKYATVEEGEPYPPEGECDEPMHWCVEGGLQNSVWFTFIGPDKGKVSIDAPGMDNQLALYKSAHCDSLFYPENFEMIAAFDDYYTDAGYYAAAIEDAAVIPGERYFIQVDGSAGGDEGVFDLFFYDFSLGIKEVSEINNNTGRMIVFPNPGNGIFEFTLEGESDEAIDICLFDTLGKLVYSQVQKYISGIPLKCNVEFLQQGIYYLLVTNSEKSFHGKLIIQ